MTTTEVELPSGFKVGDRVMDSSGRRATVVAFPEGTMVFAKARLPLRYDPADCRDTSFVHFVHTDNCWLIRDYDRMSEHLDLIRQFESEGGWQKALEHAERLVDMTLAMSRQVSRNVLAAAEKS